MVIERELEIEIIGIHFYSMMYTKLAAELKYYFDVAQLCLVDIVPSTNKF